MKMARATLIKQKKENIMKILLPLIAFLVALIFAPTAYAGPGHDHAHGHSHSHKVRKKLDEAGAIKAASKGVGIIIEQKHSVEGEELDADWGKVPEGAKTVSQKGKGFYIVKFEKSDASKSLYVLMSDSGVVYDTNYSGEFKGVNGN
jgi:hypothetical protein